MKPNIYQEKSEKTYKYNFQVRGYELDSFAHVNNAVYLNYLEQARWEILNKLNLYSKFKNEESLLIVVEANIKYINELKLFEKAIVETKMYKRGFFIEFKHEIFNEKRQKITKATVKCLFVDKDRNPTDLPNDLIPFLN